MSKLNIVCVLLMIISLMLVDIASADEVDSKTSTVSVTFIESNEVSASVSEEVSEDNKSIKQKLSTLGYVVYAKTKEGSQSILLNKVEPQVVEKVSDNVFEIKGIPKEELKLTTEYTKLFDVKGEYELEQENEVGKGLDILIVNGP